MTPLPLRSRPLGDGRALFVNDAGRFFAGSEALLDRMLEETLEEGDREFLASEGHAIGSIGDLRHLAHARGIAQRMSGADVLDYLILVPTLRCNLSCSYCQVSRVAADRPGHDWSPDTLQSVLQVIDDLATQDIKIEFQGGEPTLRPDLIRAVIDRCGRFRSRSFVVCTNLARLDEKILDIFDHPDVFISTSLDGDTATHRRNRTGDEPEQEAFARHLDLVLARYGPAKVSALPTIDPTAPPDIDDLIDSYAARALNSIFLRLITFHGFARKRHAGSIDPGAGWRLYYRRFVRRLIDRNWEDRGAVLEETYLSICLRRVFRPGADRHVDLRNPNPMGVDYVVVDHDGTVYPTDEARMLARSGVVDLSIGDVRSGWKTERRETLNRHATNAFDPACQRCAYQPYCGRDVVDDIARYGTIDIPRRETEFCRRHLDVFDLAFELIYSEDPATRHSVARWLHLPGDMPELAVARA